MKEQIKIVITGHVDHGKSTLIGRLLHDTNRLPEGEIERVKKICEEQGKEFEYAFLLDHMEEERQQGITIDTAQKFFSTQKRDYVIIDAPGHKEFIKNMITGASQADAALLLVDAKEGVKEQTKRHAYLLSFLGIKQILVLVNKMDLMKNSQETFDVIKKELIIFLNSLGLSPAQVIPISAKEGENLARRSKNFSWYSGPTVLEALEQMEIKTRTENLPLRFIVQDVYKVEDKRITAGRVESGLLRKGQEILLLPSKKTTTITSVESFLEEKTEAEPGESTGFTTEDPLFIERGEVVCEKENLPTVSSTVLAKVFWMSKNPVKKDELLQIKCGTQQIDCVIEEIIERVNSSTLTKIEGSLNELKETEAAKVKIKAKKPLVVESFSKLPELGRFVLVKEGEISAGGIIENDIN